MSVGAKAVRKCAVQQQRPHSAAEGVSESESENEAEEMEHTSSLPKPLGWQPSSTVTKEVKAIQLTEIPVSTTNSVLARSGEEAGGA